MTNRECWKISRAGNLDRLELKKDTLPDPPPGSARIRVQAVGLNFADIFAIQGLYSATPEGEFIPGLEFSGSIEQLGSPSADFKIGDRIMGAIRFGAYATHLNIDLRYIKHIPEGWSFAQGAAFPAQGLTAWYAMRELGNFKEGQTALVHSAAGGVGLMLLALIKKFSGKAIATIGTSHKIQFLMEHAGLKEEEIVVRNAKSFARDLKKSLGDRDLDTVFDAVGGPYIRPAYELLGPGGRYVIYGYAVMMNRSGRPDYAKLVWHYLRRPKIDPLAMISDNKSVMGFNLIWLWDRIELMHAMMTDMLAVMTAPPYIGRKFPFSHATEALTTFQSGLTTGKVVLEI